MGSSPTSSTLRLTAKPRSGVDGHGGHCVIVLPREHGINSAGFNVILNLAPDGVPMGGGFRRYPPPVGRPVPAIRIELEAAMNQIGSGG